MSNIQYLAEMMKNIYSGPCSFSSLTLYTHALIRQKTCVSDLPTHIEWPYEASILNKLWEFNILVYL